MRDQDTSFRVERTETAGETELSLFGVIDEHADLDFLGDLHGKVRLELGGLHRINSHGVRTWMTGISEIPKDAEVELHHCPPAFVDQLNLVSGFCSGLSVVSIMAPYECERCLEESDHPIDVDRVRLEGKLPRGLACPSCGGTLVPNEVESVYLSFLEHYR